MHIKCTKQNLVNGISIVQKAIVGKSPMPVLEGIYLEAKNNTLLLRGTDIDLSIETLIDCNIIDEGKLVIDSKLFGDIIRKLPNNEINLKVSEGNNLLITCENSKFNLLYLDPEDFPKLPEIEKEDPIIIEEKILRDLIKGTSFSVAVDETRPILMGALFEVKNKVLNMVALDGFRLALRSEYLDSNIDISLVIPGKTLNEVYKLLSDTDNKIEITYNNNHIMFKIEDTKIVSRLLSGDFINYDTIIPSDYKLSFIVKKDDLARSIERASLMAKDGLSKLIKLNIENDTIIITSNSQFGTVREEVPVSIKGDPLEIAFNANYLLDVFKVINEEEILFEMTSSVSPAIIKNTFNDNAIYMVLPVRLGR